MLDLILAGPGVTPDLVCDLADEFMAGEVLTRPNAARFCGPSPMTARSIARRLALTSRPSAAHPQDAGSPFSPVPRHLQRTALRVLSLVFTFSLESPAAGLLRLLLDRRFG